MSLCELRGLCHRKNNSKFVVKKKHTAENNTDDKNLIVCICWFQIDSRFDASSSRTFLSVKCLTYKNLLALEIRLSSSAKSLSDYG
jgi:hypothetical protein